MIVFSFTINSSFLNYPTHPITVPRSCVDYRRIRAEFEERALLRIVAPNGVEFTGELYFATAGYGEYYQIRVKGGPKQSLSGLTRGDRVSVQLAHGISGPEVRLSHH